jgi:lysophospholipase L1-like esterase
MDLVVLGDSVTWGQGLLPQHKFATLVTSALATANPGLNQAMLAHSGAVIGDAGGACGGPASASGEVPLSCPSIFQQIGKYQGNANDVPLVIVNGGINDIDIRTILNPFTQPADLTTDIKQFCGTAMTALLQRVAAAFPSAATKIVVTSYFPILSSASHPFGIPFLMETVGMAIPSFVDPLDVFAKVIALCGQFATESSTALAGAVQAVNQQLGVNRIFFAQVPFTAANSVFAPNAWLFGLSDLLMAEDEVVAERKPACDLAFKDDLFSREECYRASAGHPNVTGAQQFANAILAAIA